MSSFIKFDPGHSISYNQPAHPCTPGNTKSLSLRRLIRLCRCRGWWGFAGRTCRECCGPPHLWEVEILNIGECVITECQNLIFSNSRFAHRNWSSGNPTKSYPISRWVMSVSNHEKIYHWTYATNKDSDQRSLISVFAVRMKLHWSLGYPKRAWQRFWTLLRYIWWGWLKSSVGVHRLPEVHLSRYGSFFFLCTP